MNNKYLLLFFLVLTHLLINLPGSISKPFYSKGEPREALAAQDMLLNNDWIIAKRYGEEIQTKPPLSHWMIALSSLPVGEVTELTSRLPSIIFSLIAIVAFYFFLLKHSSLKIAFTTSLILLVLPEWLRASQTSRVDMTLACFELLSFLTLFQFYQNNFKNKKELLIATSFLSCAFLTKGPVGIILPLFSFGVFLLFQKKTIIQILKVTFKLAVLSSLAPLCWYLLAYQKMGDEFLNIVLLENFQRFTSSISTLEDPHEHSFLYLYGTLILGAMPFSVYILFSFKEFYKNYSFKKIYQILKSNQLWSYLTIIIICYLIFFSIPSSKRSTYLLPIYPMVAFFIAFFLQTFTKQKYWKIINRGYLSILCLLGLSIGLFLLIDVQYISQLLSFSPRKTIEFTFYQDIFNNKFGVNIYGACLVLLILIPIIFKLVIKKHPEAEGKFLFTTYLLLLILINGSILPEFAKQLTTKKLANNFAQKITKPIPIYTYEFRDYALNFYLHGRIDQVFKEELEAEEAYLIVKEEDWQRNKNQIKENYQTRLITRDNYSFNWPSKTYRLIYAKKRSERSTKIKVISLKNL